jgi:endonuclease/exonuclease/phosphatase family metal-dependent hydrolase
MSGLAWFVAAAAFFACREPDARGRASDLPNTSLESPAAAPPKVPIVEAQSPPSPAAFGPPARLVVATWNLSWLRAELGAGQVKRTEADFERLRRIVRELDADVIAVQEVDGPLAAARVFDPERYAFVATARNHVQRTGFAYDKRLAVQSMADHSALDAGGLRYGADLRVDWEGGALRLLSVHLKSGCFEQPLAGARAACRKLAAQLPHLEAWVDARAAEGSPFMVLGDFNRRLFKVEGDPFWLELDDGVPPESDLESATRGQRSTCWGGEYPDFIDHIVSSRTVSRQVVPGSFVQLTFAPEDRPRKKWLSDHCPLSITLEASRKQAASVPPASPAPSSAAPATLPTAPGPSALDSPVKGNISRGGNKLYHLPACPNYTRVKIDVSKGEGTFADEAAAQAAGFEKSPDCP